MNGYVNIDLNGRQRGLKFNMYAFELLSKRAGSQFREGDTFTSQLTSEIVYSGMMANCWVKEVDPDFSFEEVTDWVENLWYSDEGQELLIKIFEAFQASKPVQRGKEIVEKLDEETKKKLMEIVTGTPSKPLPSESLDSSPVSTIT